MRTWSMTIFSASGDAPLKALRGVECFTRVVRACPLQAHWLDGEPITRVLAMGGILDRYRRFVVDGNPVVTGYAAVGDAWACTNPSAGARDQRRDRARAAAPARGPGASE